MAKNDIMRFRVNSRQRKEIELAAQERGYKNLAPYMRYKVLSESSTHHEVKNTLKEVKETKEATLCIQEMLKDGLLH